MTAVTTKAIEMLYIVSKLIEDEVRRVLKCGSMWGQERRQI